MFSTSTSTQGFQSGGRAFAAPHSAAQTPSSKTALNADPGMQEHPARARPSGSEGTLLTTGALKEPPDLCSLQHSLA